MIYCEGYITKCPENQYNLVAMVTYLNENHKMLNATEWEIDILH